MSRNVSSIVVLFAWVVGAMGFAASTSGAQGFALRSHESFVVQFTDPNGQAVQVTENDAKRPMYRVGVPPYTLSVWEIVIPGSVGSQEVWVGAWRDPATESHKMGVFHPAGYVPIGWRVDYIDQLFDIRVTTPTSLDKLRFAAPIVYGPTLFPADRAARRSTIYPTFLQTQQVTLEDTVTGEALTMISDDDFARRKELGFETDGTTTGIRFRARYYPQQGVINPLQALWVAPYHVRLRAIPNGGLKAAFDWYRAQQAGRPTSFLASRTPTATKTHPLLPGRKFVIGVGATLSTIQTPAGRYDISRRYRKSVLDFFAALHGPYFEFYHLDPSRHPASGPLVYPDVSTTILPGSAALIQEGASVDPTIWHTAYTLPIHMHPLSVGYDSSAAKLDRQGAIKTGMLPNNPAVYHELCWYAPQSQSVYTSLYVNDLFGRLGFDGVYFDAVSAAPVCHAHFGHRHPFQQNEQQIGIDNVLTAVRDQTQRRFGFRPYLSNETPTDSMHTDASAMDIDTFDPRKFNLFGGTYSGREWPVTSAVFSWDAVKNEPSDAGYTRGLANALAAGVLPLVLWPEHTGKMPLNPAGPELAVFIGLLTEYAGSFDRHWAPFVKGRRLAPLDPTKIISGELITPPQPFLPMRDPISRRWRIPGHRKHPRGGSYPSVLEGRASPAVLHGVHEPDGQPGVRAVLMVRWAHPKFADEWGLGAGHPLRRDRVVTMVDLSPRALYTTPGARVELLDLRTGERETLGRLAEGPNEDTRFEIVFERVGAKALIVTPETETPGHHAGEVEPVRDGGPTPR